MGKKELKQLKKSLPIHFGSSVFLRVDQSRPYVIQAMITGPNKTPYESGCFEFDAVFKSDYPNVEPKVLLETTGCGSVRFNPNLYDCGKVCLSLLGTWRGQDGESWNKDTSTFLQVLVSIQSLILVEQPYFNEPGWEREMHTQRGKEKSFDYNDNIRYYTFKWAIVDKFENPPFGFEELTKNHFILKKEEILEVTKVWVNETKKHEDEMKRLRLKLIDLYEKAEKNSETDSIKKELLEKPKEEESEDDSKEKMTASEEKLENILQTEAKKMVDKLVSDAFAKEDEFEEMDISDEDDSAEEIFIKPLILKPNIFKK